MPAAQLIQTQRAPQQPSPLETTLKSFSNRLLENKRDQDETDALKEIYGQFQADGANIEQQIKMVQTDPRISPTNRVNTVKQLMEFQKYNGELQKKAAVDLKKANDEQKKRDNNKAILDDLAERRGLDRETLNAYEDDYKLAEQITRPAKEGKELLSNQPIDPDQLRRIQHVRSNPEYESASASKKYKMLTESGVSRPNAESEAKIFAEEEKNKPGKKYDELREKDTADYVKKSFDAREHAEETDFTIKTIKKAINGDVTGPGGMALVKNNPYGQLYFGLTPDEASLQAANKKLLETSKGIFGSKPTEREIFLLLNSMLPAIGRSKESNLASLYFIEKLNDLNKAHGDIVEELTENGYVPNLESKVNKKMKPLLEDFKKEVEDGYAAMMERGDIKPEREPKSDEVLINVKAPNGTLGTMTQKQIDEAKARNAIFTPIKK